MPPTPSTIILLNKDSQVKNLLILHLDERKRLIAIENCAIYSRLY